MNKDRKRKQAKGFFSFLMGLFVIGVFVIIAAASDCDLSCPECEGPDSACEECVYKPNCGSDCCRDGKICCDKKKCFDPITHGCCGYGTGKTCPSGNNCCGEACCNPEECEACGAWPNEGQCVIGNLTILITWEDYENCSKRKQWPGYTPTTNGCSTPTGNNPAGGACGEASSFLNACNTHDECYGRCGSTQGECDEQFGNNLDAVCRPLTGVCYSSCNDWATIYAIAVDLLGEGYWKGGQLQACGCCNR